MKTMIFFKYFLSLSVCCTALVGDYIVFKSKHSKSQMFRAVSDSAVHAAIGFLSSVLFFTHAHEHEGRVSRVSRLSRLSMYAAVCYVSLCTLLSSFIDVDHAIAARSLYLKDMSKLKQRGILHCTTLWLVVTAALLLYSYLANKYNIFILNFMVTIAYTSHHIRDGHRRGLWLYPFGHTPPLTELVYVSLLGGLPNVYGYVCKYTTEIFYKHNIVDVGYRMMV